MPLNKVFLYTEAIDRRDKIRRQQTVSDLVNSIGISLSGKGFKEYIEKIGGDDGS
jgi:hypothetical protein